METKKKIIPGENVYTIYEVSIASSGAPFRTYNITPLINIYLKEKGINKNRCKNEDMTKAIIASVRLCEKKHIEEFGPADRVASLQVIDRYSINQLLSDNENEE